MMGGDDDDGDTIVETQEISSENLFHGSSSEAAPTTSVEAAGTITGGEGEEDGGGTADSSSLDGSLPTDGLLHPPPQAPSDHGEDSANAERGAHHVPPEPASLGSTENKTGTAKVTAPAEEEAEDLMMTAEPGHQAAVSPSADHGGSQDQDELAGFGPLDPEQLAHLPPHKELEAVFGASPTLGDDAESQAAKRPRLEQAAAAQEPPMTPVSSIGDGDDLRSFATAMETSLRQAGHDQVYMRSPCCHAVVSQATDQPYAAQHLDAEVVSVQPGHRVESWYRPADEPQRRHDTAFPSSIFSVQGPKNRLLFAPPP
eukprot:COSAG01_NODE_9310_length_2487_cov_69.926298_2_plen_314_part_00